MNPRSIANVPNMWHLKVWPPLLLSMCLLVHSAATSPLTQKDEYDNYAYNEEDYGDTGETKPESEFAAEKPEVHAKPQTLLVTQPELLQATEPLTAEEPKQRSTGKMEDSKVESTTEPTLEPKPQLSVEPELQSSQLNDTRVEMTDSVDLQSLEVFTNSSIEEETDIVIPHVNETKGINAVPASCTQPPDSGMCRGNIPMFYFDPASKTCRRFVYGGCRGNDNLHQTATECYNKCYPQVFAGGRKQLIGRAWGESYLTLHDGRGIYTLTFLGNNPSAKVDDEALTHFSMNDLYQFEFYFRTDSPHGLIAFLRKVSVTPELQAARVQLYIYLKRGHLAVTHVFKNNTETFCMDKGGLQDSSWHHAVVRVSGTTRDLVMEVDNTQQNYTFNSPEDLPSYTNGTLGGFASRLWIGGVPKGHLESEDVVVGIVPFHGCMRKLGLASGHTEADMSRIKVLRTTSYNGVTEHCRNNCNDRFKNLCSPSSQCVEHFDHSTCSCFGSGQDGLRCSNPETPILTLHSDGYVVHRLYEWMDRVHSYNDLISIDFKTTFTDSILFHATAEHPEKQYVGASITSSGSIYVEVDLGGGAVSAEVGQRMVFEHWHTLTLVHHHETLKVYLDDKLEKTLIIPGEVHYLHLDPDFYVGNAPGISRLCGLPKDQGTHKEVEEEKQLQQEECQPQQPPQQRYYYDVQSATCIAFNYSGCGGNDNRFLDQASCMDTCYTPGLRSLNSFMGCLKNVFFNDISILQQLKEGNKSTRYIGMSQQPPLDSKCNKKDMVQVTLSTESASIKLTNPNPENYRILISFRPSISRSVVASGYVYVLNTWSEWEIHHDENYVYFDVHDNIVHLKPDGRIKIDHWQYMEIRYENDLIIMRVNQMTASKKMPGTMVFSSHINIGASILKEFPGFIGCLRKVEVGGETVDIRSIVGTPLVSKDVTFDNCQVLGPCERPGSCEHGATCTVVKDGIQCNCSGTGYTGKTCHFSLYRKSCEQYRQIGYNISGIYKIDVDGNGPLPPAFVKCSFSEFSLETTTIVEHNLPENSDVRRPGMDSLQLKVSYRDFTDEMLKVIISQSNSCSQEMRYNCRRSPLKLSTRTWFSSPSDKFITSFGSKTPGLCTCKDMKSCYNKEVPCNCDVGDGLPREDKAIITNPSHLPITTMVFLQDPTGTREDTEGIITLDPLKCTKEALEEQTVSFRRGGSYLEVPAWRVGSLFLSFKTTSRRAVIAYQPAYHPSHASFKISLVGGKEIEFMYSFRNQLHRSRLSTRRPLNTGSWQQLLVDIYDHQLRLVVNSDEDLIDIEKDVNLGVLDGSMFLGAIPPQFLTEEDKKDGLEGLVGCIRGLALNDELVDLKAFVRASAHGVSSGCTPSCEPNPCKNGALCTENWGSYECVCKNPFAHSGRHCEININEDALTFTTLESKLKYFTNDINKLGENNLLTKSFLINFRTYSKTGLILFAYDSLHNFIQLYLAQENEVVFLFNYGYEIKRVMVTADSGVVFNKGQSVQLSVERTSSSTSMRILTNGVFFNASVDAGVRLFQDNEYQQLPFGSSQPLPEIVRYPHSPTKPMNFFQVYLGSANDIQYDVHSSIPGIEGCIRGLKIGSSFVSLTDFYLNSTYPVDGIKMNCTMACDHHPCLNNGICTEDFHYFNNFQCDCVGTSYTGPTCSAETAYTFSGRQWISQDSATSPIKKDFRFEMAFSASTRHSRPQLVALLRSTDLQTAHDYFLVSIEPNGSLLMETQLSDLGKGMILGTEVDPSAHNFNAFDGYRHFVIAEKSRHGMTIKVDGEERDVLQLRNIVSETNVKTTPTGLYLGGVEAGIDDRLGRYDNFHGCISNVKIRTPEIEVMPLQQYGDNDLHFRTSGVPGYGSCAKFAAAGVLMAHGHDLNVSGVMGEEWAFRAAQRLVYQHQFVPATHPERNTPMDNVVPAVAGAIFLVCTIIVIALVLKAHRKRKERKELRDAEESVPLFNGGSSSDGRDKKEKIFTVSEKEMMPLNSKTEPDDVIQVANATPVANVETKNEAKQKEALEKDVGAAKQEPLDAVKDQLSKEEGSPSSTRVQRGSIAVPYVEDEEESYSAPKMLSYRQLPSEDDISDKTKVKFSENPEDPEENVNDETKPNVHRRPELGDEVQKIVKEETEDDIDVVDDEEGENNNKGKVGEQSNVPFDDNAGKDIKDVEMKDIAEDSEEIKKDEDSDIDVNDYLEEKVKPEDKSKTVPQVTAAQEPTMASEEIMTDSDDNPQEKELSELSPDGKEDFTVASVPSEQGKQKGTESLTRPEDEDDDDDFIELRPEREDIHDAHRMSAKTLEQFEDHNTALCGKSGEEFANWKTETPEDENFKKQRNNEILVDVEYHGHLFHEKEKANNESELISYDNKQGQEPDLMKNEDEKGSNKEYTKEIQQEENCVEGDASSNSSTPVIIISPPDEQLQEDEQEWECIDITKDDKHTTENDVDQVKINQRASESQPTEENKEMDEKDEFKTGARWMDSEDVAEDSETKMNAKENALYKEIPEETGTKESLAGKNNCEDAICNKDGVNRQETEDKSHTINDIKNETIEEKDNSNATNDVNLNTESPGDPFYQRTDPEGMSEEDWSILNQTSMTNKSVSSEAVQPNHPESPVSDDDSEDSNSPTYLNYIGDDDVCLEGPEDADNTMNLFTIRENEEADHEGEEHKAPGLTRSKHSIDLSALQNVEEKNAQTGIEERKEDKVPRLEGYVFNPSEDHNFASGKSSNEKKTEYEEEEEDDKEDEEKGEREKVPGNDSSKEENPKLPKKGRVVKGKKINPIFLSENVRTFSNPISYLGGPSIEYEEGEGATRSRSESLTSVTSID
ncbi:axotactin-like isoform X3 [Cherax quadricarinatus]|uniref:axotactin-like isoform X3 n=1 Tax=Cherax quadricarinatus TaxID=27406 RepID=UPI00387E2BE0